jgi:adenylate cyclase
MAMLRQNRGLLIGFIERHHGRVVNTAGDGLLAEFASVVEAVLCAIEVQRELAAPDQPLHSRMQYRIGINLGDVMIDDDDLFGEGVNVAARLQSLADPGGIMISGTVHDLVRGKLDVSYDDLGPQQVKNISVPVSAYRIALEGNADIRAGGSKGERRKQPGRSTKEWSDPATSTEAIHAKPLTFVALAAALMAFSIFPSLEWAAWPGLILAYCAGISAIARRLRGRARAAGQIGLVLPLLLGINILSSSGEWWFIYPGIVLSILCIVVYPHGPSQLIAWIRRG